MVNLEYNEKYVMPGDILPGNLIKLPSDRMVYMTRYAEDNHEYVRIKSNVVLALATFLSKKTWRSQSCIYKVLIISHDQGMGTLEFIPDERDDFRLYRCDDIGDYVAPRDNNE